MALDGLFFKLWRREPRQVLAVVGAATATPSQLLEQSLHRASLPPRQLGLRFQNLRQNFDSLAKRARSCHLCALVGIIDNTSLGFRNESELLAGVNDPERVYMERILPTKLMVYQHYAAERFRACGLRLIAKILMAMLGLESETSRTTL